MPAGAVDRLSTVSAVQYVQRPVRINRLPREDSVGTGTVVGNEVQLTNADVWQQAGITGGTKVGIIDFFDLTVWNPTENGPVPDPAHQFCPDLTDGLCTAGRINSAMGDRHGVAVAEIVKDMAPASRTVPRNDRHHGRDASRDRLVRPERGVHHHPLARRTVRRSGRWHRSARCRGRLRRQRGASPGSTPAATTAPSATAATPMVSTPTATSTSSTASASTPCCASIRRTSTRRPASGLVAFDGIRWANDWNLPANEKTDYSVEVWQGVSEASASPMLGVQRSAEQRRSTTRGGRSVHHRPRRAGAVHPHPRRCALLAVATRRRRGCHLLRPHRAWAMVDRVQRGQAGRRFAQSATDRSRRNRSGQRLRHRPLLIAGPDQRRADQARRVGAVVRRQHGLRPTVLQRHQRSIARCCRHGRTPPRPRIGRTRHAARGAGQAPRRRPRPARSRQRLRRRRDPASGNTADSGRVAAELVHRARCTSPPARHPAQPRSSVPATSSGRTRKYSIIDLDVAVAGVIPPTATSVAVNVTSTDAAQQFYVQVLPTLGGALGRFSTINVAAAGQIRPNFAVVPVSRGSISIFIPTGGNIIVDAMGFFTPSGATASGRFVPINPRRALDTRPTEPGPVPSGWAAHRPAIGESVRVELPAGFEVPSTGVSALVVNVTATDARVGPASCRRCRRGALRARPRRSTMSPEKRPQPTRSCHSARAQRSASSRPTRRTSWST